MMEEHRVGTDMKNTRQAPSAITILLVEDDEGDAFLIREMLAGRADPSAVRRAERFASAVNMIAAGGIDIVLLDLGLPDSAGIGTVKHLCERFPDLPIVALTGLSDEYIATQAVHEGAQDYLVKGQINGDILSRSIRYALERKKNEQEKNRLIRELQGALSEIKTLRGILPICSHCKRIRDDQGAWSQLEVYISTHTNAEFSHGMCSECAKKYYPEYYKGK
jgi:DNA-binding NtrC family response regulator